MTALKKYERLESIGLWREGPGAQRREVIVSFREATLIVVDGRSETALSHWSLPAVERLNPGEMPALFGPGAEAAETLEIDDRVMIEALETVHRAVEARNPHPGRMRNILIAASVAAGLALAVFWLPGAMIRHTAAVVPPATRLEIGRTALADVERVSGSPCANAQAEAPLAHLSQRLFPGGKVRIVVLRDTPAPAAHLPGDILLVDRHLIEDYQGPDVLAGYLLVQHDAARRLDPLVGLLRWAGLRATFALLTSGGMPSRAIRGYGQRLLARPQQPVSTARLAAVFQRAGVPMAPYLRASGQFRPTDVPASASPADAPVLSDNDWVALQQICSG